MGHMDADLMGPAGFESELNISMRWIFSKYPVMGSCRFAPVNYRHSFSLDRMTTNRRLYVSARSHDASHNCPIDSFDFMLL